MNSFSAYRPAASKNENSWQIRHPKARRLPNCSCDRIAATRSRSVAPRKVRLIRDCAMTESDCTAGNALFSHLYRDIGGLCGFGGGRSRSLRGLTNKSYLYLAVAASNNMTAVPFCPSDGRIGASATH